MANVFFTRDEQVHTHERNLPHWDQGQKLYFVTFRLADSIPEQAFNKLQQKRRDWQHLRGNITSGEHITFYRLFNRKIERWLDDCHGSCLLASPECSGILTQALHHFDRKRYRLDHWVIMPNHVHILVLPLARLPLTRIIHSWKSYSANTINRRLGRSGPLWRTESFDCIVRSPAQLCRFREYIVDNASRCPGRSVSSIGKWDD